jgi:hypothetical protein
VNVEPLNSGLSCIILKIKEKVKGKLREWNIEKEIFLHILDDNLPA